MLYFANPCTPAVRDAMSAGLLGYIDTPKQGNRRPDGVEWCADNGCYSSKWSPESWWRWLSNQDRGMRFAACPDVVGDWSATLHLFDQWAPLMRSEGLPVACVAQDGATASTIPWGDFSALFIGGSTEWKLASADLIRSAKLRDCWVHVGRVNSLRRLRWAASTGADSVDGTFLTFGPDKNLPRLLAWLRMIETQTSLGLEIA